MQSASFSGRPQKSIQQILSCCITPPAALCDVQISLLLFLIGFLLLLYFNPFCSVCQVLPPNSPAFSNRIIHIVFHCHYFFHRNTFKNRHLHFKPYPEERIHTQCKKYGSGQKQDRIAFCRICRNIADHKHCACNSDYRQHRSKWNLKTSWCFRKTVSEYQHINMCKNIRHHPEYRSNQNKKGNCIR